MGVYIGRTRWENENVDDVDVKLSVDQGMKSGEVEAPAAHSSEPLSGHGMDRIRP